MALNRRGHFLWILAILALISCAEPAPVLPSLPPPDADSCQVRQYASLIGQDATALERVLILGQVRIIRPGTAVTQDYRAERINFYVAADNQISRITCG